MRNTTRLFVLRDSIVLIERLRGVVAAVAKRDRSLADQLRRAASSVALNLAEGAGSSGGNRRARFESALGSAQEARVALQVAAAWGYVARDAELEDAIDHIAARIYKLTR